MPAVQIDGVDYVPAGETAGTVGVAITTHNRNDQLAKTIKKQLKHLPAGAVIFVVDDGSKIPVEVPQGVGLYRLNTSQGIVAAKNKCLELLLGAGCDELFLFDDDAFPLRDGWHQPYIDSPEHHLAYQFEDLAGPRKLKDITRVYESDKHVAYTGQRGVMLYYTREAVEAVGGFDPVYGRGYFEHVDLAYRIHEAGLTTFKYMDVKGSSELIYSMDEHSEILRSTPQSDHEEQVRVNANIFNSRRDKREAPGFVEFRTRRNVVLTSLLTAGVDPQRGTVWESDYKDLRTLHTSMKTGDLVLFHDNPVKGLPGTVEDVSVQAQPGSNPYFLRWVHAYKWLRANDGVGLVVCCDANDVEFLQDPFGFLNPGLLTIGDEYEIVRNDWIVRNHQWQKLTDFWEEHGDKQLLNMGFVAGGREVVLEFLHHLITEWEDFQFDAFNKRRNAGVMVGDMGLGNLVAYTHFSDRLFHGPRVNTGFKKNERNTHSLIKHK